MAITNDELLEDLKQFINAKVDGVETRLGNRIDRVESRLDGVESRLDGVESRLDGVESRLDGVESRLGVVESRLKAVEEDLHEVKLTQNEILDTLGTEIVDIHETQEDHAVRIAKLEAKAA